MFGTTTYELEAANRLHAAVAHNRQLFLEKTEGMKVRPVPGIVGRIFKQDLKASR